MTTDELIAGATEDEFLPAFWEELESKFSGELVNLVLAIYCCVENLDAHLPESQRFTAELWDFVENIELRIRKELE